MEAGCAAAAASTVVAVLQLPSVMAMAAASARAAAHHAAQAAHAAEAACSVVATQRKLHMRGETPADIVLWCHAVECGRACLLKLSLQGGFPFPCCSVV